MAKTKQELTLKDLLNRLIQWFLGKAPTRLETFEDEVLISDKVTLIRYRRKTVRAYRTWRIVYKSLEYDLVMGWDTLEYIPDVPGIRKKNRLSTHLLSIYKQGLHARYNPERRVHEPDIVVLLKGEATLETAYMEGVVQSWRLKTFNSDRPIKEREDVFNLIIDEVAKYAIRHPPPQKNPVEIRWRVVVEETARRVLGVKQHRIFGDDLEELR